MDMTKLNDFKNKYRDALDHYENYAKFDERQAQYDGTKKLGTNAKDATVVWNISQELIESQIDSNIPPPKITPQKPNEKTLRNAQIIQDMIKNELDRLPFEVINDEDERTSKVNGGSAFLIEWDNSVKTHDTVGDVSVRLINAKQVIPQRSVYETRYMDRVFLTFEDTKERIKDRYGISVEQEGTDPQTAPDSSENDLITQVICYYRNSNGWIGCYSWAGDTVLIDDDNFEARKDKVCEKCGLTKPEGENQCICGSKKFTTRSKDFEIVEEDIPRYDGSVIPAITQKLDQEGDVVLEDYQTPEIDQETGYPVMDYVFDDMMQPIGEQPRMTMAQRPVMENTKLPYYYPKKFPVLIRKNISQVNNFLGISDCDIIKDFQLSINKILSKANIKSLKSGSYLAKPSSLKFEFSDEDVKPLNVDSPEQMNMIKNIDLSFDVTGDMNLADKYYYMAKSALGITDSYQGKEDPTAVSGRAKEAQIAQAAGRQRSKRVMKNAVYADIYEMMFKFMLSYADEPRVYTSIDEEGNQVQRIFNRYDFLEQDEYGNWYYDDQYLFSVDESSIDVNDKRFMLEDLRTDLNIGAYGNPQDPNTMIAYWQEKEVMGYPNAARNIKRWQDKKQQMQEQREQELMGALQTVEQQNQMLIDNGLQPMEIGGMQGATQNMQPEGQSQAEMYQQ